MPIVSFTPHLERYFPGLQETEVSGLTVADVIRNLQDAYPGLPEYILDERGCLRKHVNIFIGNEQLTAKSDLSFPVESTTKLFVFQALSGG